MPADRSVISRPVGPLRAGADGRFLVAADGSPFFWLADTAWELAPIWYGPRIATDPDGVRHRPLVDFRPVYDALASGIRTGAGADASLTYHPSASAPVIAPPPRTSAYFADRPWLGLNMLQSGHGDRASRADEGGGVTSSLEDGDGIALPTYRWGGPYVNHLPVSAEYRSSPTRPVVDGEPAYEDHPRLRDAPREPGTWRAHHARIAAYQALFAGAAGHTYGHVSLWDFTGAADAGEEYAFMPDGRSRPAWPDGLDGPASGQMIHARRLIESRQRDGRIPDDALVLGGSGPDGEHRGALRGADGSYAFIHLPRGGAVTVDVGRLSGPGPAWWYDPRTGSVARAGEHDGAGSAEFVAPGAGSGHDWVLVLDDASRGHGAPGGIPATEEES